MQKLISFIHAPTVFVAFIVAFGSSAALADVYYVQSAKAKIRAEAGFNGKILVEIPRGAEVQVTQIGKRWHKVRHSQYEGWVSHWLLSQNPPTKKVSVLDAEENNDKQANSARRRASSNSMAAATRGLRGESRARMSAENQSDLVAVKQMESSQVGEREALEFLKEGLEP